MFKIARPKDHNVNAAITDFDGDTIYYENGAINQQNSLISNGQKKQIKIKAYKLETLLNNLNVTNVDYLNIDVEGNDFKVISNFNFSKFRPKLISIEQNIYNSEELLKLDCHKLLTKNNYFLTSKIGVTCIYIDKKYEKSIQSMISM